MKKILITGASGFIGSFLVEKALEEGFETWAAVRRTSSREWLADGRIRFIELDFGNPAKLEEQLAAHCAETGCGWDYVIHAAGLTKSPRREDFHRVNTQGTLAFAAALLKTRTLARRFVFLSSLSVLGPNLDESRPLPDTAYGKSKLAAERGLEALAKEGLECIILRPTGVYGPRERDYFLMAKSIAGGIDFAVGFRPQHITFIYARDLVNACFLALTRGTPGEKYVLSDGNTYTSRDFSALLQKEMGKRHVLRITAPVYLLHAVCWVGEHFARFTGKPVTLNADKFRILKQRDWRCDISKAHEDLGFAPEYPLARGTQLTVAWYKENRWL